MIVTCCVFMFCNPVQHKSADQPSSATQHQPSQAVKAVVAAAANGPAAPAAAAAAAAAALPDSTGSTSAGPVFSASAHTGVTIYPGFVAPTADSEVRTHKHGPM